MYRDGNGEGPAPKQVRLLEPTSIPQDSQTLSIDDPLNAETVREFLTNLKKTLATKCSVGTQTEEADFVLITGDEEVVTAPVPWLSSGGLPLTPGFQEDASQVPPVLPPGSPMLHPAYLTSSAAPPPLSPRVPPTHYQHPPRNTHEMKALFDKWMRDYQTWFRCMFGADVTSFEDTVIHEAPNVATEPVESTPSTDLDDVQVPQFPTSTSSEAPAPTVAATLEPVYASTGRPLTIVSPAVEFMALNFEDLSTSRFARKRTEEVQSATPMAPEMHSVQVGPSIPLTYGYLPQPRVVFDPYLTLAALAQLSLQFQQHPQLVLPPAQLQPVMFRPPPEPLEIVVRPGMAVLNHHRGPKPVMTPWGPLLRYGNYGIHKRNPLDRVTKEGLNESELESWRRSQRQRSLLWEELHTPQQSAAHKLETRKESVEDELPPQPPPYILLPKQTMICKLQVPLQAKRQELDRILQGGCSSNVFEITHRSGNERRRHVGNVLNTPTVNYVSTLHHVVMRAINLPVRYFFTQLRHLPGVERAWYGANSLSSVEGEDPDALVEEESLDDMVLCDCLIGDVLIVQVLADWKRMARDCAAREVFRVLSQPTFIAGALRSWYGNEFMVVCLTHKPGVIPLLPPFLSDPCEPLRKKDQCVNEGDKRENFQLVHSLPLAEFWLFAGSSAGLADLARLTEATGDTEEEDTRESTWTEDRQVQEWLQRSAYFSQMLLSYEVVVLPDARFRAYLLVDKEIGAKAEATSLRVARALAARRLLRRMALETAVVGLDLDRCRSAVSNGETGVSEEAAWASIVWGGQRELRKAVSLAEVAAGEVDKGNDLDTDPMDRKPLLWDEDLVSCIRQHLQSSVVNAQRCSSATLETVLGAFAESTEVTPVFVDEELVAPGDWPEVKASARQLGLLPLELESLGQLRRLVFAKRIPLSRLKKTLLERRKCGALVLLQPPVRLPDDFHLRHDDVVCMDDDDQEDELRTESDSPGRDSHILLMSFVKEEPTVIDSDTNEFETCSSIEPVGSSRQSNEILDDLPKSLIPGIDF